MTAKKAEKIADSPIIIKDKIEFFFVYQQSANDSESNRFMKCFEDISHRITESL